MSSHEEMEAALAVIRALEIEYLANPTESVASEIEVLAGVPIGGLWMLWEIADTFGLNY